VVNPPAFPGRIGADDVLIGDGGEHDSPVELPEMFEGAWAGMTLRDYFAAAVMTGVVAHETRGCDELAARAYALADAMLAARKAVPS
jgi:hypothetical protein